MELKVCSLLILFMVSSWAQEWLVSESSFHSSADGKKGIVNDMEHLREIKNFKNRGSDGEHVDAIQQYFYGVQNGIALELGAVDGTKISETRAFAEYLGWRRILVEADPTYRNALGQKMNTFSVNAAICNKTRELHYIRRNMIGGILEFFSETQVQKEFPALLKYRRGASEWDWKGIERDGVHLGEIAPVHCIRLTSVFERAKVNHVDLLVLDTEGSELDVLESIDFQKTTFSVIVVETESVFRSPGFSAKVTEFLRLRGYSAAEPVCGRNSWFTRDSFQPSVAPFAVKGCFRGAITACRMRAKEIEAAEFEKQCSMHALV